MRARTVLAGRSLGERSAPLPAGMEACWDNLRSLTGGDRLAGLGRGLWRTLFDKAHRSTAARLVDTPRRDRIDLVVHLTDELSWLPVELLRLPDGRWPRPSAGYGSPAGWPGSTGRRRPAAGAVEDPGRGRRPGGDRHRQRAGGCRGRDAGPARRGHARPCSTRHRRRADPATGGGRRCGSSRSPPWPRSAPRLRADQYHVLHLFGHGSPAGIELEDEDGNARLRHRRPARRRAARGGARAAAGGAVLLLRRLRRHRRAGRRPGRARARIGCWPCTPPSPTTYATALGPHLYRTLADRPRRDRRAGPGHRPPAMTEQQLAAARRSGRTPAAAGVRGADPARRRPDARCATRTLPEQPAAAAPRSRAAGGGVRELPLGSLIGRRGPLRTAVAVLRGNPRDRETSGTGPGSC